MCVVTQTVERVAREMRDVASRIEVQAPNLRGLAAEGMGATMDAHVETLRGRAAVLRAQAKLLDGKD